MKRRDQDKRRNEATPNLLRILRAQPIRLTPLHVYHIMPYVWHCAHTAQTVPPGSLWEERNCDSLSNTSLASTLAFLKAFWDGLQAACIKAESQRGSTYRVLAS